MEEKTIIFYGENWTPLSNDCYGCYNYGTLCGGSVYSGGECPAGILEDEQPSLVASLLLKYVNNRFILARAFGYDIENVVDINDLKEPDLLEEYQKAIETTIEKIEDYRKMYSIELFSVQKI
ncbi:hypothetical protein [Viridibacillus arvi]|uniref:hypothetical protein n=1 Tax=Viridibacillus arvi TaxID=263475 RepID=UPI0034CDA4E2